MGFRTIIVNDHSKLSYKNNHLIYKSAKKMEMIHLSEIDVLILETTDIAITSMLISKLTDENILTIFCNSKKLPTARLTPYYGRNDSTLQLKKQISWSVKKKDNAWLNLLYQKIYNQYLHLYKCDFNEQALAIFDLLGGLEVKDPSNREGHGARINFNTLFGQKFTRELDNDINASLNYGYSLLMSIFAREIARCGCLTQLGVGHVNQFNDFNFASDLMEPFRVLIDEIVYEYREKEFSAVKRELLKIFTRTYSYEQADMYLTNIVRKYTRQFIDYLNDECATCPVFER